MIDVLKTVQSALRAGDDRRLALVLTVFSIPVLLIGWNTFWFLTDDAFIAFRYVSNSRLGYGYTWNPPPFLPVEGYSSFLWVVLLDVVWRLLDVEPPDSANYMSLVFATGSVYLSVLMVLRLQWSSVLVRYRLVFAMLMLAWLLFNRTFNAWTSSGLETAMFNFFVLLWFFSLGFVRFSQTRRVLCVCVSAVLIYLTRPDGTLFALTSVAYVCTMAYGNKIAPLRMAIASAPMLIVPVHFLWRYSKYHAWWPNTYYAKVGAMWPESGVRYLLSFVLEYAIGFGLILLVWAGIKILALRAYRVASPVQQSSLASASCTPPKWHGLWFANLTLLIYVAYYTVMVGGDHFEYRVFSCLLPPLFLSALWAVNVIRPRSPLVATGLAALFVLLALPVPWTHWALTHRLDRREETAGMKVAIAPFWPPGTRWYARSFDRLQIWLIDHAVCMRHQEHKIFFEFQQQTYPSREQGSQISSDGYPILAAHTVGVPSWALPHVYVIDLLGLNDYVIARTPTVAQFQPHLARCMAHEHFVAPARYLASYPSNVSAPTQGQILITLRSKLLTAEYISQCELQWRNAADKGLKDEPMAWTAIVPKL